MNLFHNRCAPRNLLAAAAIALLLLANTPTLASPGAHGPNGEHLDAPATARATSATPRLEAKSDLFELVGHLYGSELSVLIDRFETNEPVLGATVEVESGSLKASATFHADQGNYAIDDPAFLKLIATPGEHALVFTVRAGQDNDLLDGSLVNTASGVTGANDNHGHGIERATWIGAGVATLGLMGSIVWWRQRRRQVGKLQGGL